MKRAWPVALDDVDPEVLRRRTGIALETVVGRIRVASFFYPALFAAYLLLVLDAPAGDLGPTIAALGVQLVLAVARAVAYHRSTHARQVAPDVWRRVVAIAAASVMFVWDAYLVFEVAMRGLDADTMLLLAASLVFRASGTYGASPDLYIHGAWSRWSRLPLLAVPFVLPMRDGAVLAFALLSQFVYGEIQAKQLNAEFWRRVVATDSLAAAHAELRHEVAMRERAEIELRLAQKLESVGRLAAGVAHELNTPIQYVNDSCAFIRDGVVDLIAVVAAARECCPIGEGAPTAFAEACEARDVEYLAANLEPAIQRAVDGLDRMAKIVRSMKEFSHPDQSNKLESDINRGLLATIEIARNEYKHVADVKTELGELPLVWCHIGELNQAFLNIIVNAAHAIGDVVAAGGERGSIAVRTWCDGDDVKIRITDTGGGIPETVREHIFDPFFTTKEVGKGTGQGLAIVRAVVVDKHGGAIDLATDVGKGTTFTLTVPVRSVEAPVAVAA